MLRKVQDFLICSYFFSINFQEYKLFNLGFLSIPKIVAFLYIISLLPSIQSLSRNSKVNYIFLQVFIFYFFLVVINIFNISSSSFAFFDFSLFTNIVLFWLCSIHFSRKIIIAYKAFLFLALGSALLAVFNLFGIGVEPDESGRIYMFGDNPNFVGIKMVISIILILFLVIQNNLHLHWFRYFLLIPIPIMLKLLIETGSRVSLISFILMVLVGFYYVKKSGFFAKLFVLLALIGLVFYVYNFILENQLLLIRLTSSIDDKDLAGRDVIFSDIWGVVKYDFIFGIGQTGYFARFGDGSPHNVLLEIFCYSGIIGLFIFLIFLFSIFKVAFKSKIFHNNILPLVLLIPLLGLILSGQILTLKLGWVIFSFISSRNYFLKYSFS